MKRQYSKKRRTFYRFLSEQLGDQVPIELLPRRVRILGHVALLWIDSRISKYKELIGQAVLKFDPKIRSVLKRTAAISGPYRQPAVELIAGSPQTETSLKENQVVFHLDPMKVMFSTGNKTERLRMSGVGTDEVVIDMFAGIGQFSLPIAVHAKPKLIHAIEWNPDAYHYLSRNIEANKVSDIMKPHFGDTGQLAPDIGQGQADRVIMGLIEGTTKYLEQGMLCLRSEGIMHIHEIGLRQDLTSELRANLEKIALTLNRKLEFLKGFTIKTYNPRFNHFVLDVQIKETR